jgi:hypothetical protein
MTRRPGWAAYLAQQESIVTPYSSMIVLEPTQESLLIIWLTTATSGGGSAGRDSARYGAAAGVLEPRSGWIGWRWPWQVCLDHLCSRFDRR